MLTPIIILIVFADVKPNGEYNCGERSPDLATEQERIVCENQHYNITGKNKTTINGVETYCCPSPWIPDKPGDHPNGTVGLEIFDPGFEPEPDIEAPETDHIPPEDNPPDFPIDPSSGPDGVNGSKGIDVECGPVGSGNDPAICGFDGEPGPIGLPPFGAIGFGKGIPNPFDMTGMDNPHFTPCYPHPNTFETICKDDVTVVTGSNNTIIPLVGNIDFYHIHDFAKAKHTLTLIMKDGRVVEIG